MLNRDCHNFLIFRSSKRGIIIKVKKFIFKVSKPITLEKLKQENPKALARSSLKMGTIWKVNS